MKDILKGTGFVRYELLDEKGNLKDVREVPNLIVTVGKSFLAAWLTATQASGFMQFIALGTGSASPTLGDTTLQIELSTRVSGTLTSASNVLQNLASFGPGVDTGAITESGLFSASSSGTMFARQVFSTINKGAGDTLNVTWQITFS